MMLLMVQRRWWGGKWDGGSRDIVTPETLSFYKVPFWNRYGLGSNNVKKKSDSIRGKSPVGEK